jgi:hypothetical protein
VQHQRPSAAADLGLVGAVEYFRRLMQDAVDSIPECPSRSAMRHLVWKESERLMPQSTCDRICREQPLALASGAVGPAAAQRHGMLAVRSAA